jgi:non-specific serine/threonine protein kinase
MYEMATTRRPFSAPTNALLIESITQRSAPPPGQSNPNVPEALNDLILRLLNKDPASRPATAASVIGALREPLHARVSTHRALAVLPFHALVADAESADLGLGLADATIAELSLVKSLLVRPTAAILRFTGRDVDPIEAGKLLAVEAVVAGTFQKAGTRIRVSVQLISVAESRPLWSTKIDTTIGDFFLVQDEVARRIADALQIELTPADAQRLAHRVHAPLATTELYMRGRVALLSGQLDDLNRAIEAFEEARAIDPSNPLSYSGLATAYSRLAFTWDPNGGWYERAKEYCDRALKLDATLPEARYLRGHLAWTPQGGFKHEYAIGEIMAALKDRPNLSEGFDSLAVILFHVGLVAESQALFTRAMEIYPDDKTALIHVPTCDLLLGRYAGAEASMRRIQEKDWTAWLYYTLAHAQLRLGHPDGAERTLDSGQRRFPGYVPHLSARAVIAAVRGDELQARREIASTQANDRKFGHYHHSQLDVGCALALLGRTEEALTWVRAAAIHGFPSVQAFRDEPFLHALRSHEDFIALLAELEITRAHYMVVFGERRHLLSRS